MNLYELTVNLTRGVGNGAGGARVDVYVVSRAAAYVDRRRASIRGASVVAFHNLFEPAWAFTCTV